MSDESAKVSAQDILEAATMLSKSLDGAPLSVLRQAHSMLEAHFLAVTRAAAGSLHNAAEQRMLGIIWAELEISIDFRRPKKPKSKRAP